MVGEAAGLPGEPILGKAAPLITRRRLVNVEPRQVVALDPVLMAGPMKAVVAPQMEDGPVARQDHREDDGEIGSVVSVHPDIDPEVIPIVSRQL